MIDRNAQKLLDHELLEYLLALALPRRDTKPLAKRLIVRFGSYAAVVSASPEELAGAGELTEGLIAAIKIAQAVALRLLESRFRQAPVLGSWQALLDYLRADMAFNPINQISLKADSLATLRAMHQTLLREGAADISQATGHPRPELGAMRRALTRCV